MLVPFRRLLDVFVSYSGNLYLVFELLDKDLKHVFDDHRRYSTAVERCRTDGTSCTVRVPSTPSRYPQHAGGLPLELCRSFLYQMVAGLHECHAHRILHRDLKPHNLLINNNGELKLADFGLARPCSVPPRPYTHEVVTLWYRPPEVLLGGEVYTATLDIWSVGCIFAEMFTGRPLFPGDSEIDETNRIFEAMGTPTEASWPGCTRFPKWNPPRSWPAKPLETLVPSLPPPAAELVAAMLCYAPEKRPSALDILRHPFLADLTVETAVATAGACLAGRALPPLPSTALSGTVPRPSFATVTAPTAPGAGSSSSAFSRAAAAGGGSGGAGFADAVPLGFGAHVAPGFGAPAAPVAGVGFPTAGFGAAPQGPEEEEDHEM